MAEVCGALTLTQSLEGGHAAEAAVLCVASGGEGGDKALSGGDDGAVCLWDLRAGSLAAKVALPGVEEVAAVQFNREHEGRFYMSAADGLLEVDLRRDTEPIRNVFTWNKDEVNAIAINSKSSFLAAPDDSGGICVVDLAGQRLHRTLKQKGGAHENIASCAAFRSHRPWEVLSGGLDCRLVLWDFSSGKPKYVWNLASQALDTGSQMFNPPLVHALDVPQTSERPWCSLAAIACGDGSVAVYNIDAALPSRPAQASAPRGKGKKGRSAPKSTSAASTSASAPADVATSHLSDVTDPSGRIALLGGSQGGHVAAATAVAFLPGTGYRSCVSGGNDGALVVWHWQKAASKDVGSCPEAGRSPTAAGGDCEESCHVSRTEHANKVNFLAVAGSDRVCVADVTNVVSVYAAPG